MLFKVLKKDLRKKKSINIIIVIFVFMATLFISASVNQLLVTINGLDNFFKVAEVTDYNIFTIGSMDGKLTDADKHIIEVLDAEKEKGIINSYEYDTGYWMTGTDLLKNNETIKFKNSIVANTADNCMTKFFDEDNNEIKAVPDGYAYVGNTLMNAGKYKKGDILTIFTDSGFRLELEVKGMVKDAVFGGELMGNGRILVSAGDLQKITDSKGFAYAGLFGIDTDHRKQLVTDLNNESCDCAFSAEKDLLRTAYIMNIVMALLLFLVSAGLVLISVLILRFTIIFTINDAFKEIGIMKAIGIKDKRIRRMYIVKYAILTIAGAIAGLIVSIFVSGMLVKSSMDVMVIKNGANSIIAMLLASVLMVLLIIFAAYRSTKKVKKMKPMDAIRNGADGQRFKKKGLIRLKKKRMKTTSFLALNDITVGWKKFLIPMLTSVVGAWLMIMPATTVNTLTSDKVAPLFGFQTAEYCIVDDKYQANAVYYKERNYIYEGMDKVKETLEENGYEVENIFVETMHRIKIRKGDQKTTTVSVQGINTKAKDYTYREGKAPKYPNEVAITEKTAGEIDAGLGDTIYIMNGDVEEEYVITAIYQSMNNMGQGIRFHEDADISMEYISSVFAFELDIKGDPSTKELSDILTEEFGREIEVTTFREYVQNMIGSIINNLQDYKILVILVVLLINTMVIILMQRTFIIREKSSIASLKSVGYSNRKLMFWQTKRMAMAVIIGTVIGMLTSGIFTDITSGQVFKFMGVVEVDYMIRPVEVYVIYPIVLVIVSILACFFVSRRVKRVDVRSMNVE
ncbi:MAG: ABC transporter permease [Eubacterium sp.]|nr:ABC transporter permease [Eubacterium sp.]